MRTFEICAFKMAGYKKQIVRTAIKNLATGFTIGFIYYKLELIIEH